MIFSIKETLKYVTLFYTPLSSLWHSLTLSQWVSHSIWTSPKLGKWRMCDTFSSLIKNSPDFRNVSFNFLILFVGLDVVHLNHGRRHVLLGDGLRRRRRVDLRQELRLEDVAPLVQRRLTLGNRGWRVGTWGPVGDHVLKLVQVADVAGVDIILGSADHLKTVARCDFWQTLLDYRPQLRNILEFIHKP